jgi:hypothetical protein
MRQGFLLKKAPREEQAEEAKAMSIIDNLKRTEVAVYVDNFKGGDLGRRIGNAAVKAIMKGFGSTEWKKYMALFCDTPEELERLTVEKETDPNYMPQMRAYIVSNAVCAGDTGTRTANKVDGTDIEPAAGAAAAADVGNPAAVRDFDIPQV